MKRYGTILCLIISIAASDSVFAAEKNIYPAPRFPSYTKAPKSVEEVMPFVRAIARQTTGLQGDGFGILKDGESVALVLTATADDMAVQALQRAIEERGVKVNLLYEHELVVSLKSAPLSPSVGLILCRSPIRREPISLRS